MNPQQSKRRVTASGRCLVSVRFDGMRPWAGTTNPATVRLIDVRLVARPS